MYPEQIFELILHDLRRVVPFDGATVLTRRNGRLVVVCTVGWFNPAELAGLNGDLTRHETCYTCIDQTKPVLVKDAGERSYLQLEPLSGLRQRAWLGLPMRLAGRVAGWLGLARCKPGYFSAEYIAQVEPFLKQLAIAVEMGGYYHREQEQPNGVLINMMAPLINGDTTTQAIRERYPHGRFETNGRSIPAEPARLEHTLPAHPYITLHKTVKPELCQHCTLVEELLAERAAELVEANQDMQQEMVKHRKAEAALREVQGQLEQRVADRTAELEQANKQMAVLLDALEQRVADRTRELTTFLDLTMLVSEAQTLTDILEAAIDRVLEVGQCQAVCLHLPNEDQSGLELAVQRGLSREQQQHLHRLSLASPLGDWLDQPHEPVLNFIPATTPLSAVLHLDGFHSYLGAQLRVKGQGRGLLSYYRQTGSNFSLDEISLLAALAEQLGIVIENHRLRGHIEDLAVVHERQRLARELHDSITQSLYSLNLFAHAGREAAEDGDTGRLDDSLARVENITLSALKEMRLLLYQLQPEILAEKGLAEALQIRFDSVERRLGIRVEYQMKGQMALPEQVAEALYRAALEALNNALKHAAANQMAVCLRLTPQTVRLEIADNGQGFDPAQVKGGMGLKNMRQRLEEIGGRLELSSEPEVGTRVILTIDSDLPEII